MKRIVAVLLLSALTPSAPADDVSFLSARELFTLSYRSEVQPVTINRMHAWILHVEDADGQAVDGAKLEVTGGMPQHDHGLATRPRVTAELGGGDYRLDGLRFHMAGEWQLRVIIRANGVSDTVLVSLQL